MQYNGRDPELTHHSAGGESGLNTTTVSVPAGSSVAFTSDVAVYHDGPISVYMAKATSTAAAFDGLRRRLIQDLRHRTYLPRRNLGFEACVPG
jgi:hypothetical protein